MVITVTAGYASSLGQNSDDGPVTVLFSSTLNLIHLLGGKNQRPLVVTAAWPADCERSLSTFLFLEGGGRSFRIIGFVAFSRRIS